MWPRKRIDIGWSDLIYGGLGCLHWASQATALQEAESAWSDDGRAFACLSVRSGLDMLLKSLDLAPGSEVIVSAINIGDMIRVIEHHELAVVPVDIDPFDSAVRTELLDDLLTPNTRVILIAQLLGVRIDLQPVIDFARQHNLLVIEDCAQAFEGDRYRGHDDADVSMFSFGPIKTATALGGALFRVRDGQLLQTMRSRQTSYPLQSRWAFFRRILFYCVLRFLGIKWVFGLFVRGCRLFRKDLDDVLNNSISNFSPDAFFDNLRRQPCVPLLKLMTRRVRNYSPAMLDARASLGAMVTSELNVKHCPGGGAQRHSYWLAPVQVDDTQTVLSALQSAGFDATDDNTLQPVVPTDGRAGASSASARAMLNSIIYLPVYPGIPAREIHRMVGVIKQSAGW